MPEDVRMAESMETAAVNEAGAPDGSGKLVRIPLTQGQKGVLFMPGSAPGGRNPEISFTDRNPDDAALPRPCAVQMYGVEASLPKRYGGGKERSNGKRPGPPVCKGKAARYRSGGSKDGVACRNLQTDDVVPEKNGKSFRFADVLRVCGRKAGEGGLAGKRFDRDNPEIDNFIPGRIPNTDGRYAVPAGAA